jgi:transposase
MLLEDIRAIVDGQSQTDPQFKTNRLYTRLSAAQVRVELIEQKGYSPEKLPTTHKLNQRLAYYLPYHSKYNPIERVWGVLEHHWTGRETSWMK